MKRKNVYAWKQELKMCTMIFVMAILTYCVVVRIWEWDLQVPFAYYASGDIAGILGHIKNYVNGEFLGNITSMAAPFGTNKFHSLFDGIFNHVIIWILAQVTKDVGYTINIFYILTFGLSAVCTYILLRKLNVSISSSLVCGMVYSFIPGAILRGQPHIFVGSIFILPLSVLYMIYFMRGEFCKSKLQNISKLTIRETVKSADKKLIGGVIVMTMLSLSTLYYGVFSMVLLTFALIYVCVERKQLRHLYYYMLIVLSQIVTWGMIFLPQFLSNRLDEEFRAVEMVSRVRLEVETFGLKLAQLLLPISNHRISLFAEIRRLYDTNFSLINENGTATLGAVMSIGVIIGALSVFYNLFRNNDIIMISSKMIVFSILVAVVGGLSSFIGMVTYSIRSYNRMSYFIGCFAVVIAAVVLDLCIDKALISVKSNIVKRCLCTILGAILIIGAVFDQTPQGIEYDEEKTIQLSARYFKDKKFVEEIEALEEGDEMVLVLPMETMFGRTAEGKYINYDTQLMYLHSQSSSWSTGGQPGEEGWRWLRALVQSEWENIVTTAAIIGYSGIAMYTEGYAEGEYAEIREFMEDMIGKVDIVHEDASWEYYSLGKYTEKLKSSFTEDEYNVLKKYCRQVPIEFYGDELFCTDPSWTEKQSPVLVKKGFIQHGPYSSLDEGTYLITVQGTNLQSGNFYINMERGLEQMDVEMQEITEEQVTYLINLQEAKDDVEFCCENVGEDMMTINSISVRPYTKEYLEGCKLMERILDNVK